MAEKERTNQELFDQLSPRLDYGSCFCCGDRAQWGPALASIDAATELNRRMWILWSALPNDIFRRFVDLLIARRQVVVSQTYGLQVANCLFTQELKSALAEALEVSSPNRAEQSGENEQLNYPH